MLKIILYAFFILYILPQFLFIVKYPFEVIQVLTIAAFFLLGALFAQLKVSNLSYLDYSDRFALQPKVFYLIFLFYMITRAEAVNDIVTHLISGEFMSYALNNAVQRYTNFDEVSQQSIIQRFGTISFLMSGSLAASIKTERRKVHMLLILMILIESASLARLGVLVVFVTYFVEFVIRHNVRLQKLPLMRLGVIAFFLVVILAAIFLFSAYGRVSDKDDGILEILLMKLGVYTIAMYEALLLWMQTNSDQYGSTYGLGSFAGAFKILGFEFEQGFYKPIDTSHGVTNIYTNIRGFLSDFGLVGSCILMFIFGFIVSLYSKKSMSFFSYNAVRLIMIMLLFCLFSPFIHFNTLFAFILSGFLVAGVKLPAVRKCQAYFKS
jgi:oligosaccharide repeat unit polymerase